QISEWFGPPFPVQRRVSKEDMRRLNERPSNGQCPCPTWYKAPAREGEEENHNRDVTNIVYTFDHQAPDRVVDYQSLRIVRKGDYPTRHQHHRSKERQSIIRLAHKDDQRDRHIQGRKEHVEG